jgi:ribosomal protein L7/L12
MTRDDDLKLQVRRLRKLRGLGLVQAKRIVDAIQAQPA